MSATHIRFNDNIDEEYEPTDSEDDYTENEKQLLKKARKRKEAFSGSEEEVYGVGSESGDDSNESDIALSDVEGQDDDNDLPDVRAWGKDKRNFYATDYVDQDYGGYQGKDAHFAELEEEEATNLQLRLTQQLDDDDFAFDIFQKKPEVGDDKKGKEEIVKKDISKLSNRQQLEILEKESPEFFGLVEDYKAKMTIAKDFLKPTVELIKKNKVPQCKATEFVETHYQLILNYCTNIYAYLLLKISKANVQKHPVIKRLYQYRQLLLQMEPIFEETIKPQIEILLQEMKDVDDTTVLKKEKKKTLKLLTKITKTNDQINKKSLNSTTEVVEDKPRKKLKVQFKSTVETNEESDEENNVESLDEENEKSEEVDNELEEAETGQNTGKREITYQMAKNKGLTPHRKKEQRNPRVKHRNKFRKAKIRRKGAIREVRSEMSRYGGEMSGIKAGVIKSIKIKS